MDIADEGKEIVVFFAEYGFVPVFEEVSFSAVSTVKVLRIPGKELSHNSRDAVLSASEQKVDMVVHEHPGIDGAFGGLNVLSETLKELCFIFRIAEDV
jgi:hypothetical protein